MRKRTGVAHEPTSLCRLAKAAKVGLATIARIEQGEGMVQGNFSTITKIQRALEREGISFIADPGSGFGVQLQKKSQRG